MKREHSITHLPHETVSIKHCCICNSVSLQASSSCKGLWSSPSYLLTAVRHGSCLLTPRKGPRLSRPSARGNFSTSPTWSTRPVTRGRARATSLRAHRTSSGKFCQEMETCMVWACHAPRQSLQNYPSGLLGGWAMLQLAEESLDGNVKE